LSVFKQSREATTDFVMANAVGDQRIAGPARDQDGYSDGVTSDGKTTMTGRIYLLDEHSSLLPMQEQSYDSESLL
jgi:hypothetical protein